MMTRQWTDYPDKLKAVPDVIPLYGATAWFHPPPDGLVQRRPGRR